MPNDSAAASSRKKMRPPTREVSLSQLQNDSGFFQPYSSSARQSWAGSLNESHFDSIRKSAKRKSDTTKPLPVPESQYPKTSFSNTLSSSPMGASPSFGSVVDHGSLPETSHLSSLFQQQRQPSIDAPASETSDIKDEFSLSRALSQDELRRVPSKSLIKHLRRPNVDIGRPTDPEEDSDGDEPFSQDDSESIGDATVVEPNQTTAEPSQAHEIEKPVETSWQTRVSERFDQAKDFATSHMGKSIIKCAFGYLVGELFTFVPFLSHFLRSQVGADSPLTNTHNVATIIVHFNPAKTMGEMIECDLLVLAAAFFAILVAYGARLTAFAFSDAHGHTDGILEDVEIFWLLAWLGFGFGSLAYARRAINKQTLNTATNMGALIIVSAITKDAPNSFAYGEGFSYVLSASFVLFLGVCITNAICFLVWPQRATQKLQGNVYDTLTSFSTLLSTLTQIFMLQSQDAESPERHAQALEDHQKVFTSLMANLFYVRFELLDPLQAAHLVSLDDAVTSLQHLAQGLAGMRAGCSFQNKYIHLLDASVSPENVIPERDWILFERFRDHVGPSLIRLVNLSEKMLMSLRRVVPSPDSDSASHATQLLDLKPRLMDARDKFHAQYTAVFNMWNHLAYENTGCTLLDQLDDMIDEPKSAIDADLFRIFNFCFTLEQWVSDLANVSDVFVDVAHERHESLKRREDLASRHYKPIVWLILYVSSIKRIVSVGINLWPMKNIPRIFRSIFGFFFLPLYSFVSCFAGFRLVKDQSDQESSPLLANAPSDTQYQSLEDVHAHQDASKARRDAKKQNPVSAFSFLFSSWDSSAIPEIPFRRLSLSESLRLKSLASRLSHAIWRSSIFLRRPHVRFGLKMGFGAALLGSPAFIASLRPIWVQYRGEWALVAYLTTCQATSGATNLNGVRRIICTFLGAGIALICYAALHDYPAALALVGMVLSAPVFYVILFTAPQNTPSVRVALLAYNLTCLYSYNLGATVSETFEIARHRAIAVATGVAFGLFITHYIWPVEARKDLRIRLGTFFVNLVFYANGLVHLLISPSASRDIHKSGFLSHIYFVNPPTDPLESQNDPSSSLPSKPNLAKLFTDMEVSLRQSIIKVQGLLKNASHEPRLKGPFPTDVYKNILSGCQNILDTFTTIRVLILETESDQDSARSKVFAQTREEHRLLIGHIVLYFSLLASTVMAKTPLPMFLPPARHAMTTFVDAVQVASRRMQPEQTLTPESLTCILYVVAFRDIIENLDKVADEFEHLFGVLGFMDPSQWSHESAFAV